MRLPGLIHSAKAMLAELDRICRCKSKSALNFHFNGRFDDKSPAVILDGSGNDWPGNTRRLEAAHSDEGGRSVFQNFEDGL